ncbi:MAG: SDR family oxidoreductase [Spirochaetaceae bacterium]|nr:SDR family oxidoreductase [Spirochaetaceae bacterium]
MEGTGNFLDEMFSLKGKVAVVTGGAGGLPSSIAVGFAKAGARVALWGRSTHHPIEVAAREVAKAAGIAPAGDGTGAPAVAGFKVDTSDTAACEAAFDATVAQLGMPSILLNGVGGNLGKSAFVDFDETTFEEVLRLNLMAGLMIPSRVFARRWIRDGIQGSIINMTSMTSYKGLSGVWAYNAAKAGVLNLTQALAKELAPHGIRVNAIAPGFFLGYQNRTLLIREDTGELTDRGKTVIARTPFGRFGRQEELWGAALFLASERASGFVTGVSIPVDGGFLCDNI